METLNSFISFTAPSYTLKWPKGIDIPSSPVNFDADFFEIFMDPRVPIGIASTYAILAHLANVYRRKNRTPLAFTKSKAFYYFVLLHNMALCIYSGWTCVGMSHSIYKSVHRIVQTSSNGISPIPSSNSTLLTETEAGFWRSLCDTREGIWENGLAYYGFIFYLSKFYEVVDTMIILAKGRPSSLLQTYHHAGAMLSMYVGIRYAAPPIWVFVVFNSLIHTIMYFYYTLSTLHFPVPKILKQALTTCQITQFIVGGSLAFLHLFVYYFDPLQKTYTRCLANSGQTFALMVNVLYLTPLTYLFVDFFRRSYKSKAAAAAAKSKTD